MGAFLYRAVDGKGRNSKGVIEATSAAAARRSLREKSLLPVSVEPTTPSRVNRSSAAAAGGPRLGMRVLTLLTRQLATLIGSGVRVEDALKTVAEQAAPRQATLLLNLRAAVLDGRSLAAALDDYPRVFGQFYRATVRAGEGSGRLGEVMEHLAAHVETRAQNRQTVQLALLYPALLTLVSLGVIMALLTFVVPDIVRVFSSRGAELPLLTRALIVLSDGIGRYGLAGLAGLTLMILGGVAVLRAPNRRRRWHRALTRLPGVGGLVRQIAAAQYSATLATLTISNVPLAEALTASAATVQNLHIRAKAERVALRVREGAPLARAMTEAAVFPPLLIAMVASGEASGTLGQSLGRAAASQGRSIDAKVAAIVALVEPGVLLLMGGVVMLLVLSILMPIMNLNSLVE